MVKRNLGVLALATVLSIGAVPALADSAFFSFSVGDHGGGHYYNRHQGWGHGYGHHEFYEHEIDEDEEVEHEHFHSWGAPIFFHPRPVVYYQEPTVIERRVIVQEPQVISASRGRLVSNNPYCREYQRNVTVGNHVQESYGTACRQPDGAWKVVNEDE